MFEKAYAKLNLGLSVSPIGKDGYHNIESIMIPLEFHDNIEIFVHDSKDDFVIADYPEITNFQYNLCHKAIFEARKVWKFKETFYVQLHKNIFLSSGLGGGSSDAAAVLRGIIKLLNINPTEKEIVEVCKNIGSDVYFCFYSKPAFVSAKGEKLDFIDVKYDLKKYSLVLVKPKKGLSTKTVYNQFDVKDREKHDILNIKKAIEGNTQLPKEIYNDLEDPANELMPELKELKIEMQSFGFDYVFMTGGGNCYIGITESKKLARKIFNYYEKVDNIEVELTKFRKQKKNG